MRNIPKMEGEARALLSMLAELGRRKTLRDPLAHFVEKMDLTPPQLHSLMWVGLDGPLTMGELAQRVGVTEKTVTGIVDRLERDGHAQRARDGADRRVVRVRLTPGGAKLYRKLDAQVLEATATFLGLLEVEDRRALRRILLRLTTRLSELASSARSSR